MKPNLDLVNEIESKLSKHIPLSHIRQELVDIGHHEDVVDASIHYVEVKHKKRNFAIIFSVAIVLFVIVFYIGSLFELPKADNNVVVKSTIKTYSNNLNPNIFSTTRAKKMGDFSFMLDKNGYIYYLKDIESRWLFFDYMACEGSSLSIKDGGILLKKYDLNTKGEIKYNIKGSIHMLKIINNGDCKIKIYNLRVI